ncbi:substrate-binding periplasmic protein [Vibrio neptunius]|uniref:Transporter substrate-binding domain-containing protein n=1 Tax=Vibrio neptunius TaxID=170651 RepID=A0ABS3A3J7_9VIBR|nr:transporter substrate-binding domain-containing protein [Vibrio neptunius]MBN3494167.1 transporter substrate-binding domain-containing protein [Vibrio neptunius]MBN3518128.1 transporter substrate-binding domain-containing protein [Vibrio neptunius]MBN3550839.1 transporter substrate-binding domain-containing protein [Vibrio neptunius]MBN3578968.1 transporter substrate-binding domain-containing protein [Vibrio neptunius]MCH9872633.1 transporter substrate-binding domain-containing protein [Vib
MSIRYCSLYWLALLICFMRSAVADTAVIAIGEVYQNPELNKLAGFTLIEDLEFIYQKSGVEIDFVYLPNARAIRAVSQGRYQGLDLRISRLAQDKNMIKVDVPLYYISIFIYGFEGQFYNELSQVSGKVLVSQLGMKFTEEIESYKALYLVEKAEQAALMVKKGRADLWLAPKVVYEILKAKYPNIKPVSKAIIHEPLYHYIHISNKHLLPQLEQAVRDLVANRPNRQLAQ